MVNTTIIKGIPTLIIIGIKFNIFSNIVGLDSVYVFAPSFAIFKYSSNVLSKVVVNVKVSLGNFTNIVIYSSSYTFPSESISI